MLARATVAILATSKVSSGLSFITLKSYMTKMTITIISANAETHETTENEMPKALRG